MSTTRYFSTWGDRNGAIRIGDGMSVIPIFTDVEHYPITSVGVAELVGRLAALPSPIQVFRLFVGKRELDGRWICVRREFIRLDDAAEVG